jgi:hypothetical protein
MRLCEQPLSAEGFLLVGPKWKLLLRELRETGATVEE